MQSSLHCRALTIFVAIRLLLSIANLPLAPLLYYRTLPRNVVILAVRWASSFCRRLICYLTACPAASLSRCRAASWLRRSPLSFATPPRSFVVVPSCFVTLRPVVLLHFPAALLRYPAARRITSPSCRVASSSCRATPLTLTDCLPGCCVTEPRPLWSWVRCSDQPARRSPLSPAFHGVLCEMQPNGCISLRPRRNMQPGGCILSCRR